MKKQPTPKQIREHYKKCRRAFYKLQCALNEAHRMNVIDYEEAKNASGYYEYKHASVCEAVGVAKENFENSTRRQLHYAIQTELMSELKGVY